MTKMFDVEDLKTFLATQDKSVTKIYLGADSERNKINGVWYADYMIVAVVHMHSPMGIGKGCRIFGEIIRERDYDNNKAKPTMRLFNEALKLVDFYTEYVSVFDGFDIDIHLDYNPNKKFASNAVASQAIGYIKGVTQIDAKIKPFAFAASYASDRFKDIAAHQRASITKELENA